MSERDGTGGIEIYDSMDALALAREVQWDIEITEDPTEASLKSSIAIADIYRMDDRRLRLGSYITVQAFQAYIMHVALSDGARGAAQLEGVVVQGKCAGIGFIQNLSNPRMQTLFLGLRGVRVLEASQDEDSILVSRLGTQPLVVPVLQIASIIEQAA